MSKAKPHKLLRAADIAAAQMTFGHPWDPEASQISGTMLSRVAGLERTGVSLAKLAPGMQSFVYHAHHVEEEWVYILSGQGVFRVGVADGDGSEEEEIAVAAGDFMAFPAPSVPHRLRNSGDEDLVYLMGGESGPFDIVDFPEQGKRMVRRSNQRAVYDLSAGEPMPFPGSVEL